MFLNVSSIFFQFSFSLTFHLSSAIFYFHIFPSVFPPLSLPSQIIFPKQKPTLIIVEDGIIYLKTLCLSFNVFKMNAWINKRTNEQTNKQTNERTNEQTNEWLNDRTKEWVNLFTLIYSQRVGFSLQSVHCSLSYSYLSLILLHFLI